MYSEMPLENITHIALGQSYECLTAALSMDSFALNIFGCLCSALHLHVPMPFYTFKRSSNNTSHWFSTFFTEALTFLQFFVILEAFFFLSL